MYFCRSEPSRQYANVQKPVSSASATRRLKGLVRKIDPWSANSGADATLAPGDRSAGFSTMIVVLAGDLRAAIAISTVRVRSRLESLSSRMCFGSISSSGRPSG